MIDKNDLVLGLLCFVLVACTAQATAIPTVTLFPSPSPIFVEPMTTLLPTPTNVPTQLPVVLPRISPPPGLVFSVTSECNNSLKHPSETWKVNAGGELELLVENRQALLSHNQKWIVFNHQDAVWLKNLENGSQSLLLDVDIDWSRDLYWSPDDTRLYYFFDGNLWFIEIASGRQEMVTNSLDRYNCCPHSSRLDCELNIHPDHPNLVLLESSIKWTPATPTEVFRIPRWESGWFITAVDIDTGSYLVLDNEEDIFHFPSLSPDGDRIAADRGRLFDWSGSKEIVDPSTFEWQMDSQEVGRQIDFKELVNPAWSPQSNQIAWTLGHVGDECDQAGQAIFDLDRHTALLLHIYKPYYWTLSVSICDRWPVEDLVWSPDGKWLATVLVTFPDEYPDDYSYEMFWELHSALWVFSQDGSNVYSIPGAYYGDSPFWSPDSRYIAFEIANRGVPPPISIAVLEIATGMQQLVDLPYKNPTLVGWVTP